MSDPMSDRALLVAQITDCHVVEPGRLWADRLDTAATLRSVVRAINEMAPRPDLVVATGDLVNDGLAAQYANLADVLRELLPPVVIVPGNHDDRTLLRRYFPQIPAGDADDRIDVVVDRLPLLVVGLDTTIPGEPGGRYVDDQMAWLDDVLSAHPGRPTLIVQHHPPYATGIDWMDVNAFIGARLVHPVVERHRQVVGIACGHMHRAITARVGSTVATCSPSTGAQLALALDGSLYGYSDDPPAMTIHRWTAADGLVSHVRLVDGSDPWIPQWAAPLMS